MVEREWEVVDGEDAWITIGNCIRAEGVILYHTVNTILPYDEKWFS